MDQILDQIMDQIVDQIMDDVMGDEIVDEMDGGWFTWAESISSLPVVHPWWMSDLCLNFWAKWSRRSNLQNATQHQHWIQSIQSIQSIKHQQWHQFNQLNAFNELNKSNISLNKWDKWNSMKFNERIQWMNSGGADRGQQSAGGDSNELGVIKYLIISERSHSSNDFSQPSSPFHALAISCINRHTHTQTKSHYKHITRLPSNQIVSYRISLSLARWQQR